VRKTDSANPTSSTTLQSTTGLGFTLAAYTTYSFDYFIIFQTSGTGTGIGLSVYGPSTPSMISYTINIPQGSSDGKDSLFSGWGTTNTDQVVSIESPAGTTNHVARIQGVIRTGANGGTLLPRFRSEDGGNVSVQPYSWGALYTS
jgi:hypothetical protein